MITHAPHALVVHALYNLGHCPPFPFLPLSPSTDLSRREDPRRLLNTSFFPRSYSLVFPDSGVGCRYSPSCRRGLLGNRASGIRRSRKLIFGVADSRKLRGCEGIKRAGPLRLRPSSSLLFQPRISASWCPQPSGP